MSDNVTDSLADAGYVTESRWAAPSLAFTLWVNHRTREASIVQVSTDATGDYRNVVSMSPDGTLIFGGDARGLPWYGSAAWLDLIADIAKAHAVSFPPEGATYPDVLIRAFDKVHDFYPDTVQGKGDN